MTQSKLLLLSVGFIVVMIGILWFANQDAVRDVAKERVKQKRIEVTSLEDEPKASLWSQLIPKTTIQKRDEIRTQRQQELASMIENLHGVASALVVFSDDTGNAIGQAHRPMTACVTVEPTGRSIPTGTFDAIRSLLAGATLGLEPKNVTVINSMTGLICTNQEQTEGRPFDIAGTKQKIEQALGLTVATVMVKEEDATDESLYIPWIHQTRPFVRVTVPQSWLIRQSQQAGSHEVVLGWIRTIVEDVAPASRLDISVVQDIPPTVIPPTPASKAKQIAMVVGLLTLLLSGLVVDRKRRSQETVIVLQAVSPQEEARRILDLDHLRARRAIDSLSRPRRLQVLQTIVSLGEEQETPVVHVPKQTQLELTRCG